MARNGRVGSYTRSQEAGPGVVLSRPKNIGAPRGSPQLQSLGRAGWRATQNGCYFSTLLGLTKPLLGGLGGPPEPSKVLWGRYLRPSHKREHTMVRRKTTKPRRPKTKKPKSPTKRQKVVVEDEDRKKK